MEHCALEVDGGETWAQLLQYLESYPRLRGKKSNVCLSECQSGACLSKPRGHISTLVRKTLSAMTLLKLIALDLDDLRVISVQLQDAVLRSADMAFLPSEHRFAVLLNRFDWLSAVNRGEPDSGYERRQCILRFEKVMQAQFKNITFGDDAEVLELLAIDFEEREPPSGHVMLIFAGGGAVRLHVDCIEAELRDLGPHWKTNRKPQHPDDDFPKSVTDGAL